MNKKRLIVSAGLTFTGAAIALTLAFQSGKSFLLARPANAQVPVDFVEETVTRRIYFVNNDNYWGEGWTEEAMAQLYVHAWQESDGTYKTESLVPATRYMTDVLHGLYYADVTFAGAGDRIGMLIRTTDNWDTGVQSNGAILPALWSSSPDVVYLNSGLTGGYRNTSVGSLNVLGDGQMAYLLRNYQTCSAAYSDGYNAYPQVLKDFCPEGKWYEGSTSVTDYDYDEYVANGKSYEGLEQKGSTTINDKLVEMKTLYEANGYDVSNYHVPFKFGNDPYTCTNGRESSTIKYDEIADNSYKNVYSYIPDMPAGASGVKFLLTNNGPESTQINVGFGTGDPFNSYVTNSDKYDYYNDTDRRAQYNVASGGSRECYFYFDQSEGTIDGILMFIDSCWAATTTTHYNGNITISEAVYLF